MGPWQPGRRPAGPGLPLPVLPRFPGIADYASLDGALTDLGLRHAAEVLRPPSAQWRGGIRVLDGLWFPGRGNLWRRADARFLQDVRARWLTSGDTKAQAAAELIETLARVQRDDPMGVRRIVLWQLACLLKDDADGPTAAAAEALGVHESESGLLAAAVKADFPAQGPERTAALKIAALWPGTRLREASRVRAALPAGSSDHVLNNLLAGLNATAASVDELIGEAGRLQRRGDPRAAGAAWLRAVRRAADDAQAYAGLLGAAALIADAPDLPGEARVEATAEPPVALTWRPAARTGVSYRVVRFPADAPHEAVEVRLPEADPPTGVPLRYAVVPLIGDRIAGMPRATASLLLTPEVAAPRAAPVPGGVRLRWRPHPAAVEITARRSAEAGGPPAVTVPCDRDGLVERGLPPGRYRYLISCGYAGAGGRTVWSRGREVPARVVEWPSPVESLTVHGAGEGGGIRVGCRSPARGTAYLVPWRSVPVEPGEDVSEAFAGLARGALRIDGPPAEVLPPPRATLRMTAVSVLGDRAVSGPSVTVENPGVIEDLAVRRLGPDRAEVRFSWPEPVVLVLVSWEENERRISRSRHRADPRIEIPVSWRRCRVTVTPLPRPDAWTTAIEAASAFIPATRAPRPVRAPAEPAPPGGRRRRWLRWWRRRR